MASFHDSNGLCNGIAIWVDWHLDDDIVVSTGPTKKITVGERVLWDFHTRQGVHLLPDLKEVTSKSILTSSFKFDPKEGTMQFYFELNR